MTSILHQSGRKQFILPWVLLAATTTVVVVRQRMHRRHREAASKVGQWSTRDHDDEDISELTNPLQEDHDMKETAVDLIPDMGAFREERKGDEDHSNDGTEQTDTSFVSETIEL
jgi:hypothetical protein